MPCVIRLANSSPGESSVDGLAGVCWQFIAIAVVEGVLRHRRGSPEWCLTSRTQDLRRVTVDSESTRDKVDVGIKLGLLTAAMRYLRSSGRIAGLISAAS